MNNLFSVFDPGTFFGTSFNWLSGALILLFPSLFWVIGNSFIQGLKIINKMINFEFLSIFTNKSAPGTTWVVITFFTFICINNFFGLFPYVFTSSSHLSFTLALAFPLWVGHVVNSWIKQPEFAFAHLVPNGTPMVLTSFMVLIEILSNLIRPYTLAVRLAANMVAGHLLFALLSANASTTLFSATSVVVLGALILLGVLESAVSLIQGYVFSLLSALYVKETQTKVVMTSA